MSLKYPKYGSKQYTLLQYLRTYKCITKQTALHELKIQNLPDQVMALRKKGYCILTDYRTLDQDLTIVVYYYYPNGNAKGPNAKPNS